MFGFEPIPLPELASYVRRSWDTPDESHTGIPHDLPPDAGNQPVIK
jgi:hypothetical protein